MISMAASVLGDSSCKEDYSAPGVAATPESLQLLVAAGLAVCVDHRRSSRAEPQRQNPVCIGGKSPFTPGDAIVGTHEESP
jgi:hypothetical protein